MLFHFTCSRETSDYIIANCLYEVLYSLVNVSLALDDYGDLVLNKQQDLFGLCLRISKPWVVISS